MPRQSLHPRRWRIIHADCFQALRKLDPDSVDSVITDPPYGIGISGMKWDQPAKLDPGKTSKKRRSPGTSPLAAFQAFSRDWSIAAARALKPGGHIAAFASPRTLHRLECGIEEAGLEIRDVLLWLHGQGYPGTSILDGGLGTGLKPAWEPIVLARRPLDGTLQHTLTTHGTGALKIEACRIELTAEDKKEPRHFASRRITANERGRWPANLLLSHGDDCSQARCEPDCPIGALGERHRFFYATKASRRERDAGCDALSRSVVQTFKIGARDEQLCRKHPVGNVHPTVKPIELMRWLVRLVTPNGGLVLDPFAGSGSTGAAAVLEGYRFCGIERERQYVPIARARITHWARRRPDCDKPQRPSPKRTHA